MSPRDVGDEKVELRWHSFRNAVPVTRQARDVQVRRIIGGMMETGANRVVWQTGDAFIYVTRDRETDQFDVVDCTTRRTAYSTCLARQEGGQP